MSGPAPDCAALWPTLPAVPISWDALPTEGVTLPEGSHLSRNHAPDGTLYLTRSLHASEDFQKLFDGRGDYTEEELGDPYALIEQRWESAREVMWDLLAEAVQGLGQPPRTEHDRPGRTSWLLADRTITVGLNQADKDCPIEVCLWLLPPGITPDSLGL